jgi:hypothetical protein
MRRRVGHLVIARRVIDMLVPYNANDSAHYYGEYYRAQAGGDLPVYAGRTVMGGKGLGGLFKGVLRAASPLLKRVGANLGKRALKTGTRVVGDAFRGENVGRSLKRRLGETGGELMSDLSDLVGGSASKRPKKRAAPKKRKASVSRRRRPTRRNGRRLVI